MGRPARIRKKNSFMFTTKHTSFCGMLGTVILVFVLAVVITSCLFAFRCAGSIPIAFGGIGLATLLMNIIGLIAGMIGIGERDVYITPSVIAISGNAIMIIGWILLIIVSAR